MTVAIASTRRDAKASPEYPEIRVSLVVSDFTCDPEEITNLLGLSPTAVRGAGDQVPWVAGITPGVEVPRNKRNIWSFDATSRSRTHLASHLRSLSRRVRSWSRLRELPKGAKAWISCAVYDVDRSVSLSIPPDVMKVFAAAGLTVEVDYYDLTGSDPQ